jgi:hypothetical protein
MNPDDYSNGDPGDGGSNDSGSYGSGSFGDVLSQLEGLAPSLLNTGTSTAGTQPATTTPAALTMPQTYLLLGGVAVAVLLLV